MNKNEHDMDEEQADEDVRFLAEAVARIEAKTVPAEVLADELEALSLGTGADGERPVGWQVMCEAARRLRQRPDR